MARGQGTTPRVIQSEWEKRVGPYRATAAKRGGGERGSMVRGSSICFSVPTAGVANVGTDVEDESGRTKAMGVRPDRSS
jgi:hypothetical protein